MTCTGELQLTVVFSTTPDDVYMSWLDSESHALFTGKEVHIEPRVGSTFSAGDGYITGTIEELNPVTDIVMKWRTTEFPEGSPDSRLAFHLEDIGGGTRLFLTQTGLPDDQVEDYREGWREHYFEPMQVFFSDED
jgi:uncharacterized protein YndB with AHSA1/START domain